MTPKAERSRFHEALDKLPSIGARYRFVRDQCARAGMQDAEIEARWLIRTADFWDPEILVSNWDCVGRNNDAVAWGTAMLCELLERRLVGEPLSRIIGHRGFWTLELRVTKDTLDPRSDTETVVAAARDMMTATREKIAPLAILDLGTGSGAILLALLAEFPNASGLGVDLSAPALDVARDNAERTSLEHRATFLHGGWDAALGRRFDLVVSNPPYIPSADIAGLDREVRDHDPLLALDGGADGLDAYRAILPLLPALLAPGGVSVLEIGFGQGEAVAALAAAAGLAVVEIRPDLGGVPRAVVLTVQ